MGGVQKALLVVEGRAIVDRQLEVLVARFARIAVVLAEGAAAAAFVARGLEVATDRVHAHGPLGGLAAALAWAAPAPLFAVGCDMPYLQHAAVDLVMDRACASGADVALPMVGSRAEPLFAVYSARCGPLVERELAAGRLRLGALPSAARAAGLAVLEIDGAELRNADPDLRSLVNINRAGDRPIGRSSG